MTDDAAMRNDPSANPLLQAALAESEARFLAVFEHAFDAVLLMDLDGTIVAANSAACTIFERSASELIEVGRGGILDEADSWVKVTLENLAAAGGGRAEITFTRQDGSLFTGQVACSVFESSRGAKRMSMTIRDVSDQRYAEHRLRETEERYRLLVEQLPLITYIDATDEWSSNLYTSPQTAALLGYTPEDWLADPELFVKILHPDDRERVMAEIQRTNEARGTFRADYRVVARDGRTVWIHDEAVLLTPHQGQPYWQGYLLDVTEAKAAEDELRRREAILAAVSAAAECLLRTSSVEEAAGEMLERIGSATQASRVYVFEDGTDDEGEAVWCLRQRWVAPGTPPVGAVAALESFRYLPDFARWPEVLGSGCVIASHVRELPASERPGHSAYGSQSILVVPITVAGEWWGFIGLDACEAERVWSEAEIDALRVAAGIVGAAIQRERTEDALSRSEEQLHHARRMEALGRFVGGIAHDFNNILLAIKGYSDLALTAVDENDAHATRSDIVEVQIAADRAVALTGQLLTFARRQSVLPRVVDLNRVVTDLGRMLERLIGDRVELAVSLDSDIARIKADPGQLEQVLTNLAVNARDAMHDGGTLTIETRNVTVGARPTRRRGSLQPGDYVLAAVSDTGTGMDEETVAHIFEPFFTTKDPGKGTGLGLATVYGILQQSGGNVVVTSEPGRGTTFELYFPATSLTVTTEAAAPSEEPPRGTETVLVVEDEDQARQLVVKVLEKSGYRVVAASTADEARSLVADSREQGRRIDLLVTDTMAPSADGRDLAELMLAAYPGLRVLYVTGRAAEAHAGDASGNGGVPILAKPFSPTDLARKVREVLESS
jgi:PAS domain S-box-containing protein